MLFLPRAGVIRMWARLRKLGGGDAKAEAAEALETATVSLRSAEVRASEIQPIVDRIKAHGYRNHFGERIEAAIRRA
jgi:hypothetical protein